MTAAQTSAPHQTDERVHAESPESTKPEKAPPRSAPLPGVMDFVGAHVGDELAEERWRQ
jgi:hypothetical protein